MSPTIALIVVLALTAIATAYPLKDSKESQEIETLVKSSTSPPPLSTPFSTPLPPSSPKIVWKKYTLSDKIEIGAWIFFFIAVVVHRYHLAGQKEELEKTWLKIEEELRKDDMENKSEGSQLTHDI